MFHGLAWNGIQKISVQSVQFILNLILARILTPEQYGVVGILLVFIAISRVFVDSGFGDALIQTKERTQEDNNTVFVFNIFISITIYGLLWLVAPSVSQYYEIPILTSTLRIIALSLIINSFFAVPSVLLKAELNFKALTKLNLTSTLISGGIALYMAMNGYGVWALVAQPLARGIVSSSLVWFVQDWKPNWSFSMASFKKLFRYGSYLLFGTLLGTLVNNFSALFIAKIISTKDLGYYSRGTQFSDSINSIIAPVLSQVVFAGLTTVQDDHKLLKSHISKIVKLTGFITFPTFIFLMVIAESLIRVLLTEKWLPAVPIMQIICMARLITSISGINISILKAIGRSDLMLKQQYLKILVRFLLLIGSFKYGIIAVAFAELLSTLIHFFINTYSSGKFFNYGAIRQAKDLAKVLFASSIMAGIVYLSGLNIKPIHEVIWLCCTPILAVISYLIMAKFLRIQELNTLVFRMKEFINSSR